MATHAGVKVTYERSLPHHCDLRPADVLFDSWQPLPLAVDFAIVTPTRASNTSSQGTTKTNELMDTTAAMKIAKYGAKCAAEGWSFKPFIVDVYGAARADARQLISQIIKK